RYKPQVAVGRGTAPVTGRPVAAGRIPDAGTASIDGRVIHVVGGSTMGAHAEHRCASRASRPKARCLRTTFVPRGRRNRHRGSVGCPSTLVPTSGFHGASIVSAPNCIGVEHGGAVHPASPSTPTSEVTAEAPL